MRADAAWWDSRAYARRSAKDPQHAATQQLEQLGTAVLQAYHGQRVQFLANNQLIVGEQNEVLRLSDP